MVTSELEKITINIAPVDLGQVDLLVREGFYQNRTYFIRTAIRNQLNTHAESVRRTVARKELVLGLQHYTRRDLEAAREAGESLRIRVLGLASISDDVPPSLPWRRSTPSKCWGRSEPAAPSRRRWPTVSGPSNTDVTHEKGEHVYA
jgi:Arc/MetJ-type ribon-helix-helix transcriptional regulator